MPIRHCQKCGLKVLIDESQTTANPFYCQRCAATAKAGGGGGGGGSAKAPPADPIPMVSKRDSAPMPAAPAASGGGGGGKGGPVKVLCPYCKASFSGRLPAKPAKGACPVCQKELVLLPDGKIKPAATFDLGKWQKEQDMQRGGGDPAVAEQARAVQRALERTGATDVPPPAEPEPEPLPAVSETPTPPPERTVPRPPPEPEPEPVPVPVPAEPSIIAPPKSDDMGGLAAHTMLDMGRPSDLDDLVRAAAPRGKTQVREAEDPLAVLGNEPPMGSASAAEPPAPEADIQTMRRHNDDDNGPVSGDPVPVPVASKGPPKVDPKDPPPPPSAAPSPAGPGPGMGKLVFGGLLLVLPLIAGAVLLFMKNNARLENVINRVGAIVLPGLKSLHDRVSKATQPGPPPPKREPAKKKEDAPEDVERKQMRAKLEDLSEQIRIAEGNIKKNSVNPSDEMKEFLEKEQKKLDGLKAQFDEQQKAYKERFGEEFKP
jgi:hypothetical protein